MADPTGKAARVARSRAACSACKQTKQVRDSLTFMAEGLCKLRSMYACSDAMDLLAFRVEGSVSLPAYRQDL